jgi:hypothetical protein
MIKQLREVGMNRAAHVYSMDIAQSMWYNNMPIGTTKFKDVLVNDRMQLFGMKD